MLEGDQGAAAAKALFNITGADYYTILKSGRDPATAYGEAVDRKLANKNRQTFEPDKLIKDHVVRLLASLPNDRGARWAREVIEKVVEEELENLCLIARGKMSESLSDGERHSASVFMDDLFVSVSTFPCSVEVAKRTHYQRGYLPHLDRMVTMGREENPRCHWLHFQFFWDVGLFWVQFTLFPNKHVLDFPPRYILPIDLLSDEEKREAGLAADDSRCERLVRQLTSRDDATFGDGLTEVLAIPDSDALRLRAIREAIRLRSGEEEVAFYEPDVGGLTVRRAEEVSKARDQILALAKERSLLADPEESGGLLAAFTTLGGFDAVVNLAYEIRDVAGFDQFQAFQLLYNQNRSAVVLRTSRGQQTWTQRATEEFHG